MADLIPLFKFFLILILLKISAIDSWSAAWGDFDNDGYDDLFIPNKDHNGTTFV